MARVKKDIKKRDFEGINLLMDISAFFSKKCTPT